MTIDVCFKSLIFKNFAWNLFISLSTALHTACTYKEGIEVVKVLLKHEGIDVKLKNSIGLEYLMFQDNIWSLCISHKTALQVAEYRGNTEIVKVIEEYMKNNSECMHC